MSEDTSNQMILSAIDFRLDGIWQNIRRNIKGEVEFKIIASALREAYVCGYSDSPQYLPTDLNELDIDLLLLDIWKRNDDLALPKIAQEIFASSLPRAYRRGLEDGRTNSIASLVKEQRNSDTAL